MHFYSARPHFKTILTQFQSDTVQQVLERISERLSIPASQLKLYLSDLVSSLSSSEVLSAYDVSLTSILEVRRTVAAPCNDKSSKALSEAPVDPRISLKCQTHDRKSTVMIKMKADEKMRILMKRYSEEKKVPLKKLKFKFDGENLDPNATPDSLDLEGGECIDVY